MRLLFIGTVEIFEICRVFPNRSNFLATRSHLPKLGGFDIATAGVDLFPANLVEGFQQCGYVLVAIQQNVHGGLGKPFLMDIQLVARI